MEAFYTEQGDWFERGKRFSFPFYLPFYCLLTENAWLLSLLPGVIKYDALKNLRLRRISCEFNVDGFL